MCFATSLNKYVEPTCLAEALSDPNWVEAMNNKIGALNRNNTWTVCDLPIGRKPIGFSKKEGFDYDETFSPVVKMVTIRCLISIAVVNKWPLYQLDVNNAFLYGDLVEDVYMTLPNGYNNIDKSKSKFDYYLYTKHRSGMFIALLVYVDDIVITGSDVDGINEFKLFLSTKFLIKDLGYLKYFLGIEVIDNDLGLCMTQRKYYMELLHEYGLLATRPVDIPLPENTILRNMLHSIGLKDLYPVELYSDNSLAIQIASNPVFHEKTKHFELDVYFVREKVLASVIKTVKVSSSLQTADMFTKCLVVVQHKLCCKNLGLLDVFVGEFVGKVSGRKAQAPKKKIYREQYTFKLYIKWSKKRIVSGPNSPPCAHCNLHPDSRPRAGEFTVRKSLACARGGGSGKGPPKSTPDRLLADLPKRKMKSSKGFVCEFEAKSRKNDGSMKSRGHLYGLPRLMGQLGLCLPMAQAAMQNNKVSESGSAAKKVELKVYTCDINLDDSLKPILQDPIALDTDASSGKKPTYKQIIILSSIRLVIAATMNFGFQQDLEEDDSSMCGLLHNSNRHIPIFICLYEKVGGNKNKGLKLSRSPSAEKVGGNKNKGLKLSRSPSAVCGPPVSSSTKRAKNGNERRLSTSGLGDVEVWFSDDELGVASSASAFGNNLWLLTAVFTAETGSFGQQEYGTNMAAWTAEISSFYLLTAVFTMSITEIRNLHSLHVYVHYNCCLLCAFGTQHQGKDVGGDPFFVQAATDSLNVVFKMMEFEQEYNTKE
ncbi:ribonuclease H-like domain-containing protein [Tanacetum coccineum]